jgi:drug/metabolite transporter (DMT)-like permease
MRPVPLHTLAGTAGGASILIFGLFLFSLQDIILKHFSDKYSVMQLVLLRGEIAMILILAFLLISRQSIPLISKRPRLIILRGLLGFTSYVSYYLAIAAMPLAEVVAITFTMPLFVTAMSAIILREKVGIRRWGAVVFGFIGVMVILSPGGELIGEFNPLAVALAFTAAITYATHTIITRFLSEYDNPLTIALNALFIFTVASGIFSLLIMSDLLVINSDHPSLAFLGRDWAQPDGFDALLIFATGVIAAIGFYCLSKAYCMAEASAIAPFEFTYIIWAVVFGFLFWNEVPGVTTIVGILILISSSLYISYREQQLEKQSESAASKAVPPKVESLISETA